MSLKFIADPPEPVKRGDLLEHLRHLVASFGWIVWQAVMPFESQPQKIDGLPEPTAEVKDEQVKQCQWIFDQAASRRGHLEQKAQSTFGLMLFLVPALASLFVFVVSKSSAAHGTLRLFAIGAVVMSGVFLFLGFIAAVRAISVKALETLFVHSVIDDDGQFREYKEGFHARGLLYCAAMNEAMNDHIAQFVKGAHVLTAVALITLIAAAVPASVVFSGQPASPAEMKIVGPVEVFLLEVTAIRDEVASLKGDVGKLLSNSQATEEDIKQLEDKFAKLDAELSQMQKTAPARQ